MSTTTFTTLAGGMANISVATDATQINDLIQKVSKPGPALRVVGEGLVSLVGDHFRDSKGPEGREWLPILPESNLKREHPSPNPIPLRDTGVLANSFNAQLVDGGHAVSVGTPFEFYRYHQHDPDYPIDKHIMPIRNVLPIKHQPLPESWAKSIITSLEEYLALTGSKA